MLQILAKIADILLKSADFFRKFREFFDISEVVHSVRMKNSIQSLAVGLRTVLAEAGRTSGPSTFPNEGLTELGQVTPGPKKILYVIQISKTGLWIRSRGKVKV